MKDDRNCVNDDQTCHMRWSWRANVGEVVEKVDGEEGGKDAEAQDGCLSEAATQVTRREIADS